MTAVATVAGIALILLASRDVFDTLFHPHGRGVIGEALIVATWRASRVLGRRRPGVLSLAGPVAFLLVVLSWVALVIAGGALIVLPNLPERYAIASELSPDTVTGIAGAVYVSFVNLTSLGFGDVVARNDALRLLGPVQAIIGLAILTASISWILSIYRVLGEYRALAREIRLLCDAAETTGDDLARPGAGSVTAVLAGLTSQIVTVRGDFLDFPITYYFHDRDPRTDLAEALVRLMPIVETNRRAGPVAALHAERLALAIKELLATVEDEFLGGRNVTAEETLGRWQRDHLRQA